MLPRFFSKDIRHDYAYRAMQVKERLPSGPGCAVLPPRAAGKMQRRSNSNIMTPSITENPIHLKTLELCQTLLDQPETQSLLKRVETFLADDMARSQYDELMSKGQSLQQKQQSGLQLNDAEIAEFENARQSLIGNPVAREFLQAQEEMSRIRDSVQHYLTKTLELGRIPNPEDFQSCGHGCSCGH